MKLSSCEIVFLHARLSSLVEGNLLFVEGKIEIVLGRFLDSNPYFFGRDGWGGWEEKWRLRLNSAQFQVKLPVGAELGNNQPGLC